MSRTGIRTLTFVLLLPTGVIAQAQTLAFHNPRSLLAGQPASFVELLETARPAPLSIEEMGTILRSLPREGEVTRLGRAAQHKVDSVRQFLIASGRGRYEIKVIDVPPATVNLYGRAVILISAPAIELLTAPELQALAAHELGHEYVWKEWNAAQGQADQERLKELELVCDAIAAVTLHRLGMDPATLIRGIENLWRFNRDRLGTAADEKNYPTVAERQAFVRQIQQWLRSGSPESH